MARARTPTSVPGSERRGRGFTLIELMLVVALIAIVSGLVAVSIRDPAATRLEREASRLSALLESARAEARALGVDVTWRPLDRNMADADAPDFRFEGLPPAHSPPMHWLAPGIVAQVVGAPALSLGPEPLIGAQRVMLRLDERQIALATDGLGPFVVVADAPADAQR